MADLPLIQVLNNSLPEACLPSDSELLSRFATHRDHAAFELIVRRHADLVWRVCRGVIARDQQLAEDAFQATFLALTQKAPSIRENLPGWLFRVARRIAIRANQQKRNGSSEIVEHPHSTDAPCESSETATIVLEEVERLSARFRDPVLLCFYEGHTQAEAAEKLGWPLGTLSSRLARAKEKLRDRLTRRGVTLSTAGVAASLASPVNALDPAALRSSIQALLGPSEKLASSVTTLTSGVLLAMRIAKLKLIGITTAVLLGLAGVGITIGTGQEKGKSETKPVIVNEDLTRTAFPDIKPEDAEQIPRTDVTGSPKETDLQRLKIARFQLTLQEYKRGLEFAGPSELQLDPKNLIAAALDLFPTNEKVKWYRWQVAIKKRRETRLIQLTNSGKIPSHEVSVAARSRIEAEIELLKWNQAQAKATEPQVLAFAKDELKALDAALKEYRVVVEAGAARRLFDTLQEILSTHTEYLRVAQAIHGESAEYLQEHDKILKLANELMDNADKQFNAGVITDGQRSRVIAHVNKLKREQLLLKARLGVK